MVSLNKSETWSQHIEVSFIPARTFIDKLSTSKSRTPYIVELKESFDIVLSAVGVDIDYSYAVINSPQGLG